MTTSFILALGVMSLVGFLVWALVRSRLATKAKAYEAKKHRAKIDQQLLRGHPPSWMDQTTRYDDFFAGVERLAVRKGIPRPYTQTVLEKKVNVRRLTWYAGVLEDQGATWMEQQRAVADQIVQWWAVEQRTTDSNFD